jgi:hypothetical protein
MSEDSSVVFGLLIKDQNDDLLLKKDYVKQVYDRVFLLNYMKLKGMSLKNPLAISHSNYLY